MRRQRWRGWGLLLVMLALPAAQAAAEASGGEVVTPLSAAETFTTVAALLEGSFRDYPREALRRARQAAEGDRPEPARDLARQALISALESIAARVPVPGVAGQSPVDGRRLPVASLVVFNPLSWERSDLVRCRVALRPGQAHGLRVLDPTGAPVPSQLAAVERHGGGSLKAAELLFIARQVPPLGYRAFTLVPTWESGDPPAPARAPASYESHFYRVLFAHGGLNSLYDKALKRELLQPEQLLGGEVLLRRPGSDGPGAFYRLSRDRPWWIAVEHGPVRHRFQWEQATPHGRVRQRLSLYPNLKRVDLKTTLLEGNPASGPECHLAFPLRIPSAHITFATPTGVVRVSPDDYHQPPGSSTFRPGVPRWVTVGDGRFSVTLSPGTTQWEATEAVGVPLPYPILQPVLPEPVAGDDCDYRVSLTSHRGGWERGWRAGAEADSPLLAVCSPVVEGPRPLPPAASFLRVAPGNALLCSLRKSEEDDSLLLRCREMLGKPARARLELFWPVRSAWHAGQAGAERPLRVEGRRVRLRLGAHAVTTVRLSLRAAAP